MTSRDFCYWLQGFIELGPSSEKESWPAPSQNQWNKVRDHLAMVFRHEIDPSFGKDLPDLKKIHEGGGGSGITHEQALALSQHVKLNC